MRGMKEPPVGRREVLRRGPAVPQLKAWAWAWEGGALMKWSVAEHGNGTGLRWLWVGWRGLKPETEREGAWLRGKGQPGTPSRSASVVRTPHTSREARGWEPEGGTMRRDQRNW